MNHFIILTQVFSDKNIIGVISSSIFIMVLGFYLGKKRILSSDFAIPLGELILSISIPALSFNAFMKEFDKEIFNNGINIFIWSFIIHLLLILITKFIYKGTKESNQTPLEMMTTFSGITVFGIPIVQAIYGDLGIIYASVFSIPYRMLIYSYGFIRMSGLVFDKSNLKKMLLNPVIIATFLGLFFWLTQGIMPQTIIDGKSVSIFRIDQTAFWLYKPLTYLASLCSPLAWLAAGLKLSEISIEESVKDMVSWYFAVVKTIFIPILVLLLTYLGNLFNIFSVSKVGIGVMTVMLATPTASVIIAYSLKYNKEPILTSNCSFLSTVFSIFTIPMIVVVLQLF